MVRVLHTRHEGTKDLLRGHTNVITSINFAGVHNNLLATTGKDGSLIVWGLKLADPKKIVYVLALGSNT
jgi:WD40 repeat protein